MILIAIWRLKENAYAVTIREQVSKITGEEWSLGSVYMPLERLGKRGLITSYLSDKTPERGGRHKRIYLLTPLGAEEMKKIKQVQNALWDGINDFSVEVN